MKKLNITKEQFEKSRYFKNKYGKLEYVSESGKVFKTDKGKVLMFKEGVNGPGSKDRDPNPQPEDWDWVHDRVAKKLTRKIARELGSKFRSAAARDDADYIAIGFSGSIYDSPKAKAIIEKVKNMYPEQLVFSGISTLNRGKGEVTFEVNKEYVFDMVGSRPAMESSKKFNESYENVMDIEKWIRSKIKSGELPGVEKFKGGRMPLIRFKGSNIRFNYVLQQIGLDSGDKSLWSDETEPFYPPKKLIEKIEDWFVAAPESQRIDILMDALNKVYDKGGIFGKAVDKKLWLDIPNAFDEGEYIIYGKVEIPKIDVI